MRLVRPELALVVGQRWRGRMAGGDDPAEHHDVIASVHQAVDCAREPPPRSRQGAVLLGRRTEQPLDFARRLRLPRRRLLGEDVGHQPT